LGTLLGYPTIALPQWENGELVKKIFKKKIMSNGRVMADNIAFAKFRKTLLIR
jgi:hypothetical protein